MNIVVHVKMAEILSHFFTFLILLESTAKTVWCQKNSLNIKKTNTFKFSWNRSSQLTLPFIENRQINGLGTAVIEKNGKRFRQVTS